MRIKNILKSSRLLVKGEGKGLEGGLEEEELKRKFYGANGSDEFRGASGKILEATQNLAATAKIKWSYQDKIK